MSHPQQMQKASSPFIRHKDFCPCSAQETAGGPSLRASPSYTQGRFSSTPQVLGQRQQAETAHERISEHWVQKKMRSIQQQQQQHCAVSQPFSAQRGHLARCALRSYPASPPFVAAKCVCVGGVEVFLPATATLNIVSSSRFCVLRGLSWGSPSRAKASSAQQLQAGSAGGATASAALAPKGCSAGFSPPHRCENSCMCCVGEQLWLCARLVRTKRQPYMGLSP